MRSRQFTRLSILFLPVLLIVIVFGPVSAGDQAVVSLTLINADTDTPVPGFDPLPNNAVLNLATLPTSNLSIRANTSPSVVGSVQFGLNGDADFQMESTPPYALAGDNDGDYNSWTPPAGGNSVTATPFTNSGGDGTAGTPLTINFSVINTPNQLPVVDAGPNRNVFLPQDSTTLNGSASDPDGSISDLQWSQVSGPAAASMSGAGTTTLAVSDLVTGVYVFRLSATDQEGAVATDSATVLVIDPAGSGGTVSGDLVKWHPVTVSFAGPGAAESDNSPNPFLDYRLQVTFVGPAGQSYTVPGFFDGNGNGGGTGNVWRVRFSPDAAGEWVYIASFRSGSDVAVDLAPDAGTATNFDGASGTFNVAPRDPNAPGFLRLGRLEYVGEHYLKFADGPYWIKGGADSPENLLGYAGFDNTVDQSGGAGTSGLQDGVHRYPSHVADWQAGDPNWVSADTGYEGKGLIGALNYLSSMHVNSVYFLPMNLGGDGRETYPFISPAGTSDANTHYDVSKLTQWNLVFDHAQRQGVALHVVLNETESGNEQWLDNGTLGVERKLFYRELIARFSYVMALKWNLSEENDFSPSQLRNFAGYIGALDWAEHQVGVHTHTDNFSDYADIVGDSRFTATAIQYGFDNANDPVETWRSNSASTGHKWVVDMDENSPASTGLTDSNADDLRKRILYDVYFSGGNIEWYMGYHNLPLGGDMRLENFRTREDMWNYMWYARSFMQDHLPFWEMVPHDELLTGEDGAYGGGQVFARPGEVYALYLPNASDGGTLNLSSVASVVFFEGRWFNPRTGQFAGNTALVNGGSPHNLGTPPSSSSEDWVYLLELTAPPVLENPLYLPSVPSP